VVADIWGALGRQRLAAPPSPGDAVPLGAFYDIEALTMFGGCREGTELSTHRTHPPSPRPFRFALYAALLAPPKLKHLAQSECCWEPMGAWVVVGRVQRQPGVGQPSHVHTMLSIARFVCVWGGGGGGLCT
jgi:hypothetical protein